MGSSENPKDQLVSVIENGFSNLDRAGKESFSGDKRAR